MTNPPARRMRRDAASTPSKRPGRPAGSESLTSEIQETIVAYTRAGGWSYAAAEAAGISARTFHDWMARGEGRHPSRPPTRKLKAFAKAVRQAQAQARIGAEIRVYQQRPAYWLTHAARSVPGREGWTTPQEDDVGPDGVQIPSFEERLAAIGDGPSD